LYLKLEFHSLIPFQFFKSFRHGLINSSVEDGTLDKQWLCVKLRALICKVL